MELINDDCLKVMPDIPAGSIDLILTDLPFGTTHNKWDCVINPAALWAQYKRVIKQNGAILLFFHSYPLALTL